MKVLKILSVANVRALTLPRNVFLNGRISQIRIGTTTKSSFTTSARLYQAGSDDGQSPAWTPHTLKARYHLTEKPVDTGDGPHIAYIAVGSNLGDRIRWIERALYRMQWTHGIKILRTSSLWETEPMYVLDQGNFINGVVEIETDMKPWVLLEKLQSVEKSFGRVKEIDKGPRNIDLDILLYDNIVFHNLELTIPHPLMLEREFVLRPLAQLIPAAILDYKQPWKTTTDYLNQLPPSETPMTTVTPLKGTASPLRALQPNRATQVMGILNLTPDSFSDGEGHRVLTDAKHRDKYFSWLQSTILKFVRSGGSIVDIGGQSTAPGAVQISKEEEIARTILTLSWIRKNFPELVVSIDTYRSSVAGAAAGAGAHIINDVSAGLLDRCMLRTMAKSAKTVILMHMRGDPETMNTLTDYPDGLIPTIAHELMLRVKAAEKAGIYRWRIILDPGIGFAKTQEQNLEILRRFDELRDWPGLRGFPWVIGSSRKKFIGNITGVDVPKDRVWGTAATVAAAVSGGADIVRVHDVKEMAQVVKMSDAIWRV